MYDPDQYPPPDELNDHNPATCPKWLGEDAEGRPIPCVRCKKHLVDHSHIPDYGAGTVSERARAAIEKANRNA